MKLSEFKDEKAIEVIAKLLVPIANIATNKEVAAAKGKNPIEFASTMLSSSPTDVKNMLAILSDEDPESYHCSAATVLVDVLNMLNDPELMALFGLQSKTLASSGSASENTEGQT